MTHSKNKSFDTIRKILCNHQCPASRNKQDLKTIHSYLTNHTQIHRDPLWQFLNIPQQLRLCAYVKYDRIPNDEVILKEQHHHQHQYSTFNSSFSLSYNGYESRLFLLLRGRATVVFEDYEIEMNSRSSCCSSGRIFGGIYIPSCIQRIIGLNQVHTSSLNKSRDNNNTIPDGSNTQCYSCNCAWNDKQTGNNATTIHFHKGAQFIYLCSTEIRVYLNSLLDRFMIQSILSNRFHLIKSLLFIMKKNKINNKYVDDDNDKKESNMTKTMRGKTERRCKIMNIVTFPKGFTIYKEGLPNDVIMLTLRGICQLRKELSVPRCTMTNNQISNQNSDIVDTEQKLDMGIALRADSIHISYAKPMSFLGYIPTMLHHEDDIDNSIAQEETTATPVESVSDKVKQPQPQDRNKHHQSMIQPLSVVAHTNVRAWVIHRSDFLEAIQTIPALYEIFHELSKNQITWLSEKLPFILQQRSQLGSCQTNIPPLPHDNSNNPSLPNQHDNDPNTDFPSMTLIDMEEILNSRIRKNPHLKRFKLLKMFKTLVSGVEDEVMEWIEYEEPDDPWSRFQVLDTALYEELNAEIELNWKRYCEERDNYDDDDVFCNELEDCIVNNTERVENSNDDDDGLFLRPFPSIVSKQYRRLVDGKPLPLSANGFDNPYAYYE